MAERRTHFPRETRVGFATTNWTVVLTAVDQKRPGAEQAMELLCRQYWQPIYAFLRRSGQNPEDSQDLTQGFILHLLQGNRLRAVHPAKGKLRSFLLAALRNYVKNQRDWVRATKRGGGRPPIPVDYVEIADDRDPTTVFDSQLAAVVVERVLQQLKKDCARENKVGWFEALRPFLTAEEERGDYARVAVQFAMKESAVRTAVFRLRAQFRENLRLEVGRLVEHPSEVDEEAHYLLSLAQR